uniref:Uncharacterized protein n=1 Tax=Rhipicephalus zambeziensis TaxID=60191 RepID=A0A224YGZ6_9ACAR
MIPMLAEAPRVAAPVDTSARVPSGVFIGNSMPTIIVNCILTIVFTLSVVTQSQFFFSSLLFSTSFSTFLTFRSTLSVTILSTLPAVYLLMSLLVFFSTLSQRSSHTNTGTLSVPIFCLSAYSLQKERNADHNKNTAKRTRRYGYRLICFKAFLLWSVFIHFTMPLPDQTGFYRSLHFFLII